MGNDVSIDLTIMVDPFLDSQTTSPVRCHTNARNSAVESDSANIIQQRLVFETPWQTN
jgi:hypothetical protein